MNNTSNRSTPRGLNARWQSGGDSIIDDSIPLTRLLSTVKHNATFPLFLYFFFLSLPPTAFKRYNILSSGSSLANFPSPPPSILRLSHETTSLSLSRSSIHEGGKEAWQQQGSPAGVPNPRRAGTKIPNVGLFVHRGPR